MVYGKNGNATYGEINNREDGALLSIASASLS
jgi:hypothetical protein